MPVRSPARKENQVAPGIFYERVERFENIADNFINWFRVSCMHCDKPACMPVCPARLFTAALRVKFW